MNLENFTLENLSKHCGYCSHSCQSSKILPSKLFVIARPSAKFLLLENFQIYGISVSCFIITVTGLAAMASYNCM